MSRWIEVEEVKEALKQNTPQYMWGEILTTVNVQPYIDIVRCAECKHQWREHKVCAHEANVVEGVCGKRAEDDDFCSYGVRKESE